MVGLVAALSGSRKIRSPCEKMTAETHYPQSSVCLFQINLARPQALFYINLKWRLLCVCVFFLIRQSWKRMFRLNGWIVNVALLLDIQIYSAIIWYEDFLLNHGSLISVQCSTIHRLLCLDHVWTCMKHLNFLMRYFTIWTGALLKNSEK